MFGNLRRASLDEANEYLRKLIGVVPSQLPIHLDALVSGSEPSLTDAIYAALETDGPAAPIERCYVRADGRRVGVLMCASIVDSLHGDFIAVVIERDAGAEVSSNMGAVADFRDAILDALPCLVARLSASGAVTYCNRRFLDWFGLPTIPLGWSLEDLLGARGQFGTSQLVGQALRGGTAA